MFWDCSERFEVSSERIAGNQANFIAVSRKSKHQGHGIRLKFEEMTHIVTLFTLKSS